MIQQYYTANLMHKANQSHCFLLGVVSYPSESNNDEEINCNMIDMLILLMSYCWNGCNEWWDLVGTEEKLEEKFPIRESGNLYMIIWTFPLEEWGMREVLT